MRRTCARQGIRLLDKAEIPPDCSLYSLQLSPADAPQKKSVPKKNSASFHSRRTGNSFTATKSLSRPNPDNLRAPMRSAARKSAVFTKSRFQAIPRFCICKMQLFHPTPTTALCKKFFQNRQQKKKMPHAINKKTRAAFFV